MGKTWETKQHHKYCFFVFFCVCNKGSLSGNLKLKSQRPFSEKSYCRLKQEGNWSIRWAVVDLWQCLILMLSTPEPSYLTGVTGEAKAGGGMWGCTHWESCAERSSDFCGPGLWPSWCPLFASFFLLVWKRSLQRFLGISREISLCLPEALMTENHFCKVIEKA